MWHDHFSLIQLVIETGLHECVIVLLVAQIDLSEENTIMCEEETTWISEGGSLDFVIRHPGKSLFLS